MTTNISHRCRGFRRFHLAFLVGVLGWGFILATGCKPRSGVPAPSAPSASNAGAVEARAIEQKLQIVDRTIAEMPSRIEAKIREINEARQAGAKLSTPGGVSGAGADLGKLREEVDTILEKDPKIVQVREQIRRLESERESIAVQQVGLLRRGLPAAEQGSESNKLVLAQLAVCTNRIAEIQREIPRLTEELGACKQELRRTDPAIAALFAQYTAQSHGLQEPAGVAQRMAELETLKHELACARKESAELRSALADLRGVTAAPAPTGKATDDVNVGPP
jgi:chromosome segregation ATPase